MLNYRSWNIKDRCNHLPAFTMRNYSRAYQIILVNFEKCDSLVLLVIKSLTSCRKSECTLTITRNLRQHRIYSYTILYRRKFYTKHKICLHVCALG